MKYTALRPILYTRNLDETIQFYTGVLGFKVQERNDDWGWASLGKDDVALMLSEPNGHTPFEKPLFTGSFYFTTERIDDLWEILKNKTFVCYEIENFDWGMREFAIYDNNGYLLQFGQDIAEIQGTSSPTGIRL